MPLTFTRSLAGAIAVFALSLSALFLPGYMNRGLYQVGLMLIAGAILAEAALRRRLVVTEPIAVVAGGLFSAAVAVSFFASDMDKFDLAASTLNRILWFVTFVAVSVAAQDSRTRGTLAGLWVVSLIVFAVRIRICEGADVSWRIAAAGAGGVVLAATAVLSRTVVFSMTKIKKIILSIAMAGLIAASWTVLHHAYIPVDESEIVRRGYGMEDAALTVAGRCAAEKPILGYGAGSIARKFLQDRPTSATIRGVTDRLDVSMQSWKVLSAENGWLGLALFLAWIACPLTAAMGRPRDWVDIVTVGLAGAILTHELFGGGWTLTYAGGLLLFGVLGLLSSPSSDRIEHEAPASFFVASFIVIGGILLWQQLFWWKTYHVEQRVPEIQKNLADLKVDDAGNQIDICMVEYDPRRNDLLSWLIGAYHRAGRLQNALENSKVLLARDPDYPSVKNNIGVFYVMMGQPANAIPYLRETAEREPTMDNWTKLGHLYSVTGDADKAKEAFLNGMGIFPREVSILLARAPKLTDTQGTVNNLFEPAHFCANSLLKNYGPALGVEIQQRVVNGYNAERKRIKDELGLNK